MEKKISEVTVRMPDTMKHDLQDMAALEDRTLSDVIRMALETHLYGHKHRIEAICCAAHSCHTSRGTE